MCITELFYSPLDDDWLPISQQEERLQEYESRLEAQCQRLCGMSRKEHEADFLKSLEEELK